MPPVAPPPVGPDHRFNVPREPGEVVRRRPARDVVVHDGGDQPELVEADGLLLLLGRAAGHERHRVDVQRDLVADGGHHLAAVLREDQLRSHHVCLLPQRGHPGQLRPHRIQGVVVGAVHPQDQRIPVVDKVGGVLGQAEQPQRRLGIATVKWQCVAGVLIVVGWQSWHSHSVTYDPA